MNTLKGNVSDRKKAAAEYKNDLVYFGVGMYRRKIKVNLFIEGAYKYANNNGQIAMSDHKAAAINSLNALEHIPKFMKQYRQKTRR